MNCRYSLSACPEPSSFMPQGFHTCCSSAGKTLFSNLCTFSLFRSQDKCQLLIEDALGPLFSSPYSSLTFTLPCLSSFIVCDTSIISSVAIHALFSHWNASSVNRGLNSFHCYNPQKGAEDPADTPQTSWMLDAGLGHSHPRRQQSLPHSVIH